LTVDGWQLAESRERINLSRRRMKFLVLILSVLANPKSVASIKNRQPPTVNRQPLTEINRYAFYQAMQENNKVLVLAQLEVLKTANSEIKPAFVGAMLMKRASFLGPAALRLHYFREGQKMLQSAIKRNPDNAEFRFLRLMIQEHAPGALGYKSSIESDCEFIRKNYKTLPEEVQKNSEE